MAEHGWKRYRRTGITEMRPYIVGEDLRHVSVQREQLPCEGGMIARNPDDYRDQWYVTPEYVAKNMAAMADDVRPTEAGPTPPICPHCLTTFARVAVWIDEPNLVAIFSCPQCGQALGASACPHCT